MIVSYVSGCGVAWRLLSRCVHACLTDAREDGFVKEGESMLFLFVCCLCAGYLCDRDFFVAHPFILNMAVFALELELELELVVRIFTLKLVGFFGFFWLRHWILINTPSPFSGFNALHHHKG